MQSSYHERKSSHTMMKMRSGLQAGMPALPGVIFGADMISWAIKKPAFQQAKKILGNVLLSHEVALEVPSAQEVLTAVFGMGTGVTPPLLPPRKRELDTGC